MTPLIELVLKGGDAEKTLVYACGKCKLTATSKEWAERCCAPNFCETCGVEVKSYCDVCARKQRERALKVAYEAAKKVPLAEYEGDYLFCDCCDEGFADIDTLLDGHSIDSVADGNIPKWAWGAYEVRPSTEADTLIENELYNGELHEGAGEDITQDEIDELQNFLDAWWKKTGVYSYQQDSTVVVTFEKEVEEYLKDNSDD